MSIIYKMKRAVTSEAANGRCLKRANSSLFSISTLVEQDDPANNSTDSLSGLLGGGAGDNSSKGGLLLVDNDDMDADEEDASATYATLKASGLVPLDCSDDEAPPDDAVSSSCSSSEIDDQVDDNNDTTVKTIQQEKAQIDPALDQSVASSRNCGLPALLEKKSSSIDEKESNQSLLTTSGIDSASQCMPCEPPTTVKVQLKKQAQKITSEDHKTGLVFEAGSKHYDRHNRFHKERPLRITAVQDYLSKAKPVNDNEKTVFDRCHLLDSRGGKDVEGGNENKSPEELFLDDHDYLRVHLPGYMQR